MAISDALMVRFSFLDDKFRNGGKLTADEKGDYMRAS